MASSQTFFLCKRSKGRRKMGLADVHTNMNRKKQPHVVEATTCHEQLLLVPFQCPEPSWPLQSRLWGERHHVRLCMHTKSLQLCLTLYDPMDCSPPGSSVHGILQEWVAMPSSR